MRRRRGRKKKLRKKSKKKKKKRKARRGNEKRGCAKQTAASASGIIARNWMAYGPGVRIAMNMVFAGSVKIQKNASKPWRSMRTVVLKELEL